MKRFLQIAIISVFAGLLATCGNGGADIGPNPELLHGRWAQDGLAQADPDMVVGQAVIEYRADGTSSFEALIDYRPDVTAGSEMPAASDAAARPAMLFDIKANVLWTLEETIVTRTITDATVTPRNPNEQTMMIAAQLRQAYLNSPPGQLIVQYVDPTELVFQDPQTTAMLRYLKVDASN